MRSGAVWSPTFQPTRRDAERYTATFLPDIATFDCKGEEIATQLEIAVSPEHDVEVRAAAARQPQRSRARDRRHQLRRSGARAGAR